MDKSREQIPVLKPGEKFAEPNEPQPELEPSAVKLYLDSLPKTVQIRADNGSGSGFFMDKDGRIGTAAHVILGSREQFAITSDGTKYKLQIEKIDDLNDIAIMKPLGYKSGSYPVAEMGDSSVLKKGTEIFPMGHPQGRRPAYISPGEFGAEMKNSQLLLDFHQLTQEELEERIGDAITPKETPFMKSALERDLLNGVVHIRPGDSGGPAFDANGKVIGINDMITSFKNGYFVPVEKIRALYDQKNSDFEITYHRSPAVWAESYQNQWTQKPIAALTETATFAGAGYFGSRLIASSPRMGSLGVGLGEGMMLYNDANQLMRSTDGRDQLKYTLASAADATGLLGSAALLTRMRTGGAIGIGVGILGRIAVDFIPTRMVMTDLVRKSDPTMPPFTHDIEKNLGL